MLPSLAITNKQRNNNNNKNPPWWTWGFWEQYAYFKWALNALLHILLRDWQRGEKMLTGDGRDVHGKEGHILMGAQIAVVAPQARGHQAVLVSTGNWKRQGVHCPLEPGGSSALLKPWYQALDLQTCGRTDICFLKPPSMLNARLNATYWLFLSGYPLISISLILTAQTLCLSHLLVFTYSWEDGWGQSPSYVLLALELL